MKQFKINQQCDVTNLQIKQQAEEENLDEQMTLESKQLTEQQALQKEQVSISPFKKLFSGHILLMYTLQILEHHRLVTEQQHRQHQDYERTSMKEFRDNQKKQQKEWLKAQKNIKGAMLRHTPTLLLFLILRFIHILSYLLIAISG